MNFLSPSLYRVLGLSISEDFVILACVFLAQCQFVRSHWRSYWLHVFLHFFLFPADYFLLRSVIFVFFIDIPGDIVLNEIKCKIKNKWKLERRTACLCCCSWSLIVSDSTLVVRSASRLPSPISVSSTYQHTVYTESLEYIHQIFSHSRQLTLQCFDAVDWATGRARDL